MVSSCLVIHFLDSFDIDLRQAVVDDVAGEEVDAPRQSLFDLWWSFSIVFRLSRT
jgi:hypothetical protein